MKVYQGFESWIARERTVVTLGNYDGIHLGHQAILKATAHDARSLGLASVAVTFDPIPKKVLYPDSAPLLLQTLQQRLSRMESLGINQALVVRFDLNFAQKKPEAFVREYLIDTLQVKEFVVGENFSFGRQKSGNIELLQQMGRGHGFTVQAVSEVRIAGLRVSSTAVREMVREGRVDAAEQFLGHPFTLTGVVVQGENLGATLGIPTANLKVENEALPASGVYVTVAVLDAHRHASVTNVGLRPTVGGKSLTVEAHLLDFDGQIYGRRMELEFLKKQRDERRFAGIDELKAAIQSDIASARTYFATQTNTETDTQL